MVKQNHNRLEQKGTYQQQNISYCTPAAMYHNVRIHLPVIKTETLYVMSFDCGAEVTHHGDTPQLPKNVLQYN